MKFLISSTEYSEDNVDILKAYPGLSDFGYTMFNHVKWVPPYTSERICVEINSIEQLIEFKNAIGKDLTIIEEDHEWYGIEIGR